ncbi:MAG: serine--tRNA ligase [Candidatus Dependentiae bacterium]
MIDLSLLRKEPEKTVALLQKKDPDFDAQRLYELDKQVSSLRLEIESLCQKKNELAQQAKSGVTPEIREQSIAVGKELKEKQAQLDVIEPEFKRHWMFAPNLPFNDIPEGNKEANKVVKMVGEKPHYDFQVQNHLDLGNKLGWFDFEASARMSGSNFPLYKGDAVRLIYSLASFMYKHNMKHGYEPILPSYLVNESALEVASNFPKFRDQVYEIGEDNLFLTPTAEVNLTNLYKDQILSVEQLPVRMTSWTSCFRREAGGYGAQERGLIRIHQFEKIELYTIAEPEKADKEQERMLTCAEEILQKLGLHYRVSLLAAQDCSFPSAKTYDIEVWLPGQKEYYEVSSCSNCTDFQARRGKIRYRKSAGSKPTLVHTLNASSLALPRLMVAIMETYQQEDGTIAIPEILKEQSFF